MAASVSVASSSCACMSDAAAAAAATAASVNRNRNLKLPSWRHFDGKKYELRQLNIDTGKSYEIAQRYFKLKRQCSVRQIEFTSPDGLSSVSESDENTPELESSLFVGEKGSAGSSSCCYAADKADGKPGFISFYHTPYQMKEVTSYRQRQEASKVFWFLGPSVLVAFFVLPSLYLRKVVSFVFEDSLLTDFLILFFTEALFYTGVAIFILLVDRVWRPFRKMVPADNYSPNFQYGFRISSVATLVISLILPLLTMGLVWPWTGPAASATLAPYLVGLVVQFAFEQYARHRKSPSWPTIPVIFQVYRLHQLNRAALLVQALSFSVRGAERTPQTFSINNSLGTLLIVLQVLGVICIWSLSSFIMRFLPASEVSEAYS